MEDFYRMDFAVYTTPEVIGEIEDEKQLQEIT